jgi:hypothetical protein
MVKKIINFLFDIAKEHSIFYFMARQRGHSIISIPEMQEFVQSFPVKTIEVQYKISFLRNYCKNKNVVHFGFADFPYIKQSLHTKDFLHRRLKDVTSLLFGIDYNKDAVKYYQENTGDRNAAWGDIYNLNKHASRLSGYNVFLLGEILEHLDNPGKAVQSIRAIMSENAEIIITVPNAFGLNPFTCAVSSCELVHPDHVAWYSPNTLNSLMCKNGFVLSNMLYYQYGEGETVFKVYKRYPFIADGIIGIYKKSVS